MAARPPLYAAPAGAWEYLTPPDLALPDVTCPGCGITARATHVVIRADGHPVGADVVTALQPGGLYERLGREHGPAKN